MKKKKSCLQFTFRKGKSASKLEICLYQSNWYDDITNFMNWMIAKNTTAIYNDEKMKL